MSEPIKKSSANETAKSTGEKKPQKAKKGKTAKQIMSRHINDKNDVITEEEFKELNVGIGVKDSEHDAVEIPEGDKRPKDEDKDPSMITPWDVIK